MSKYLSKVIFLTSLLRAKALAQNTLNIEPDIQPLVDHPKSAMLPALELFEKKTSFSRVIVPEKTSTEVNI